MVSQPQYKTMTIETEKGTASKAVKQRAEYLSISSASAPTTENNERLKKDVRGCLRIEIITSERIIGPWWINTKYMPLHGHYLRGGSLRIGFERAIPTYLKALYDRRHFINLRFRGQFQIHQFSLMIGRMKSKYGKLIGPTINGGNAQKARFPYKNRKTDEHGSHFYFISGEYKMQWGTGCSLYLRSISLCRHNGVRINNFIKKNISELDELNNENNDLSVIARNLKGSHCRSILLSSIFNITQESNAQHERSTLNSLGIQEICPKSYVDSKLFVIGFSRWIIQRNWS